MVKIEELKNGAEATYTKDYTGETSSVGLHNLISVSELQTMVVTKGTVSYTIDEQEFGEKSSTAPAKSVTKTAAKTVEAVAVVETPKE